MWAQDERPTPTKHQDAKPAAKPSVHDALASMLSARARSTIDDDDDDNGGDMVGQQPPTRRSLDETMNDSDESDSTLPGGPITIVKRAQALPPANLSKAATLAEDHSDESDSTVQSSSARPPKQASKASKPVVTKSVMETKAKPAALPAPATRDDDDDDEDDDDGDDPFGGGFFGASTATDKPRANSLFAGGLFADADESAARAMDMAAAATTAPARKVDYASLFGVSDDQEEETKAAIPVPQPALRGSDDLFGSSTSAEVASSTATVSAPQASFSKSVGGLFDNEDGEDDGELFGVVSKGELNMVTRSLKF